MADWIFITRHAVVLSLIAKHPRTTTLELTRTMGVTEIAVRKIIANLAAAGYIDKKREGRGVKYRINPELSLRQDTHLEVAIGDFQKSLGWQSNEGKSS